MDEFVCHQLSELGLKDYITHFKENEVDKEAFLILTESDLREILPGKVGPQRKIRKAIDELTSSPDLPDDICSGIEQLSNVPWDNAPSFATGSIVLEDFSSRSLERCNGKVLMYIDNSNIFINTQKHAARRQKFRRGIIYDKRYRVDVGKLCAVATRDRETLEVNLYGSEPPLLDTVWKSIRKKLINVKTHKKSSWTNKEKEIDTTLVADAVKGIITQSPEKAGDDRTVILFTGDKDMLTVVRMALEYGWKVEIWSYNAALSNALRKEAKKNFAFIKIFHIDDFFESCTFLVRKWKKPYIPKERSMVLLFPEEFIESKNETDRNRLISTVVDSATGLLLMPMMAQILQQKYSPVVKNDGIPLSNKFITLDSSAALQKQEPDVCVPMVLICYVKGGQLQTEENSGTEMPPSYDFTKDVWALKSKLQESIPKCCDIITYQQYLQGVPANSTDEEVPGIVDETMEEEDDPEIDFVVIAKKIRRKSQKYSDFCEYRYRCRHGVKCTYGHSATEKEFFKEHPTARRHKYKTQLCLYALDSKCKYISKTYLCLYAHDIFEYMCSICGEIGIHFADECPSRLET